MDKAKLINIIDKGEGLNSEFKSSFNIEVIETIVAFANTKGGYIVIGVNPKSKVVGVDVNSESVQEWANEVKQKTAPPIIPDVDLFELDDKTLVLFYVPEHPIKPISTKGKYYKRVSNSNHLMSTNEVVNLHLRSFNSSWDYHTSNHFDLSSISIDKVQASINLMNENEVKIFDDPITFLMKHDLIRDNLLSNAAYLLFTNKDTVLTSIELGRFQSDIIIKDSLRIKSDLISQVELVIDFIKKHINKEIVFTGEARSGEKWQYPLEAIREVVINMIVHRDYQASSDSIVKIFDDRIEFFNPGSLPPNITVADLISNNYTSSPRNKLIADFFKSMRLIEKYGSGIRRIIKYCEDYNLPSPTFKEISGGFMVTLFLHKTLLYENYVVEDSGRVSSFAKVIDNNNRVVDNVRNYRKVANKVAKKPLRVVDNVKNIKNNINKVVDNNKKVVETIINSTSRVADTDNKVVDNLTENQKKIIASISRNPRISAREISLHIGISHRKTQENMAKLRDRKFINRVGSPKGGYWEITNEELKEKLI